MTHDTVNLCAIYGHTHSNLWTGRPCCHKTKALKGTHNPWPNLILPSSNTVLLVEGHGSLYHKGCHAPSIRQSPSLVKQRLQISITNSILISSTVKQCTPISSTISSTEEHLFNGAKLIPRTISESIRYVIDKNDCLVQYYHTLSFTHQHARYSDQPGRHFNSVEDSSQMAQQSHLLVGSRQTIQRCH